MTTFVIESGHPIPALRRGQRPARYAKYPFADMQKGESFLVPTSTVGAESRIRNAAGKYGKTHDRKFTVRRVVGGLRVWRVS